VEGFNSGVKGLMYFSEKQLTLEIQQINFSIQLILGLKFCHRIYRNAVLTYNTVIHTISAVGKGTFICFSNTNIRTFSLVAQSSPASAQNQFLAYKCSGRYQFVSPSTIGTAQSV
jgi:hypothetical protein